MRRRLDLLMPVAAALLLAGCMGGEPAASGGPTFHQAGSSTVLPIAQAWAEEFPRTGEAARFVVGGGGTGAGFKQLCRGEIDVADASRPIRESERQACAANGITPFEVQVAIDGIAVVVPRANTFVDALSVEDLHRMYTADASKRATRWSDLRPGWPAEEIRLFGPGPDSGTFDYFVEVVLQPFDGPESRGRSDYTTSEDDNVLVQGISRSPYGLGYFGLAYVEENADKVRAVPIAERAGAEPAPPTPENVESGAYKPLARPIYMYAKGKPEGTLLRYFEWGLGEEGQSLVEQVGYVKLPQAARAETLAKLRGG